MIFTQAQINDIIAILQRHQLTFIAEQLGLNYLSDTDRAILTAAGIDLSKYTNAKGIVEQAYMFGLLSQAIGSERAKGMTYKQFQGFLKSGQFVPLTDEEEFVLEQVKNQSYNDISGLGSRIIQGTKNTIVRANLRAQNQIRNIIRNKAINAVQYRQSAAKMASEIGHATGDWERDFLRISYYVLQNAYNYGRARAIFREYGEDAEVYFDVLKGACKHCVALYLEDPDDPDSRPKVFKLSEILENGNNIGRKVADWLPTVSPIHPYCRCILNYKDPNMDWDDDTHSFTKPKAYKPKNKRLQGVKLNIKVNKAEEDELNRPAFRKRLSEAKKQTNTHPTENEIKAGNYQKGHVSFGGYTYVIENPKGSYRKGVDKDGKKWKIRMNNTYGYFLGVFGKDKDHIDCFINDAVDLDRFAGKIYVIDQVDREGNFDEHKIMYGFDSVKDAKNAYLSNYEKGWRGLGHITPATQKVFNRWMKRSKRKIKPFYLYKETKEHNHE